MDVANDAIISRRISLRLISNCKDLRNRSVHKGSLHAEDDSTSDQLQTVHFRFTGQREE